MLGWSLAARLKPDRLAVFGTEGSMWDFLVESVALDEGCVDARLDLIDACKRHSVSPAQLEAVRPALANALGVDLRLAIIPYGRRNAAEQVRILEIMAEHIEAGDRLTPLLEQEGLGKED